MENGKYKMEIKVLSKELIRLWRKEQVQGSVLTIVNQNMQFHTSILLKEFLRQFTHSLEKLLRIPYTLYRIPLYLAIFFFTAPLFAQRSEINSGVDQYNKQNYADAEVSFRKGKEKAPDNFEAHFNLGDAYYKQGRFEESIKEFYSSLELTEDPELKAQAYHNIGNSMLKSQKFEESIEAYKNALKINPNDQETKYNISYALKQLEKQQNQQQQNQNQKQDQNKDQDQNQNKDQNQKDKNDQQQNNEQNKPDQNEQTQQDNTKAQQKQDQISKEEAERILQALKNNEQDIQKKVRKKTGVAVKKEKDW